MAINFTPENANQDNNHDTIQFDPTEHITRDHEDLTKSHDKQYPFIIPHYTTPYGTNLEHHPVTHQYYTHPKYFGKKLPHSTNVRRTDGRIPPH